MMIFDIFPQQQETYFRFLVLVDKQPKTILRNQFIIQTYTYIEIYLLHISDLILKLYAFI